MTFDLSRDWNRFVLEPFEVLNNVFVENSKNNDTFSNPLSLHFSLKEELEECLKNDANLGSIPLMSVLQRPETLKNGTVVRFRCMVQDMFDPEIAVAAVKRVNDDGDNRFKYSLYADTIEGCDDVNIQDDKLVDRYKLYCVAVPGENEWVLHSTLENCSNFRIQSSDLKRSSESFDESTKKIKTDSAVGNSQPSSSEGIAEIPEQVENSVAAVVKFYESITPCIKLNDKIDVIGILDLHSEANNESVEEESEQLFNQLTLNSNENGSNSEKKSPTIHAILIKRVAHNNPLVTNKVTEELVGNKHFFTKTKKELKTVLTKILFGDELAAEYLLLSLISKVFNRRDITPVGSLPVNFVNCPPNSSSYLLQLYSLLSQLIPSSQRLTITLESLNKDQFIPKKDYELNKLSAAVLQMSSDTLLLADETQMTVGQLSTVGLKNFHAIKELIHKQQVAYDFGFEKIVFDSDVNVLVFSERSSLFSLDCRVAVKTNGESSSLFDGINEYLSEPLLRDIRIYLTLCKQIAYELSKEMQTFVEHDLVSIMNEASQSAAKLSIDDLHLLLTVSRLLATSEGETSCSVASWKTAKQLEQNRRSRL